ncbi:MAG: cytochrome c [Gammaproteobacteria bacterium]|nr:cytochrome c [Gammaproteobacteria bacterium]
MLRISPVILLIASVFLTACDTPDTGGEASATAPGSTEPAAAAATSNGAELDERMVDAVKSRKSVLTVLKDNFVPLALMAMGRIDYDAEAAQTYADRLPVMIGMMKERFATDTRGSGVETEALDAVWEDMAAFEGKVDDALAAAEHLAAVASDETQFNDAVMELRDRCGSCHDDFRVDND